MIERGHQVTLATLWSSEVEREQLASLENSGLKILAAPLPRLRSLRNCLGALPTSTPLQAVYCWQPGLREALERLLKTERYDVIHVEHLRGVHYGLALKDMGIPIVWDSVDCISHLFEQAAVRSRSQFGKWITRLELGRTRHYEGWLANQFQAVLVTSEVDKKALVQLAESNNPEDANPNKINVLPNGVDQTYFTPNGQRPEAETLVFSGKMSYHANVTMGLYLVHEVMPYVWAERPNAKLVIVGQGPPASIQKLSQDPRVTVSGYVPDIRPYLQHATVAVVPAVYGAGIQNKVLEAMACGTPVVATESAVSALNLKPDHDLLVANKTEAFARQVLRLMDEPNLRQTIGANGLEYVRRYHAWPEIGANLETIYRSVIEIHREP
jgi:glycosyltransferase involved in cell wall biosynthesis